MTEEDTKELARVAAIATVFENAKDGVRVEFGPALQRLFIHVALNEGITQAELIKLTGLPSSTISIRLTNLGDLDRRSGQGLHVIEQRTHPADARHRQVFLTDRGRALRDALLAAYRGETVEPTKAEDRG